MAMHAVLIYRCWIQYRTTHSDYVLVLFAPLHTVVWVYLQMNHLFMYGERSSPFGIPESCHHIHKVLHTTLFSSLNLKFPLSEKCVRFLLWVFESNQTCMLLVSWGETFWNVQFLLLLLGSSSDRILTIVFISLSKTTPHQKSIEISSSSSVIITKIFLDYIHMSLGWETNSHSVLYRSTPKTTRLPNTASSFSAEVYAISLVLTVIRRSKDYNFVIFADSMSSLQALSGFKLELQNRGCVP